MISAFKGKRPALPASGHCWIAPNATVIGDVVVGEGASVWFGAVLRGDCATLTIGDGSNIQDACVLHADPGRPLNIGAGVTVGHMAMLHGCDVEDDVLIGIGAVVLNGARIRTGSLVGAKALVLENADFPPNSLIVGSPARAIRRLSEEDVEGIRQSALHYQQNARDFAAELRPRSQHQIAEELTSLLRDT